MLRAKKTYRTENVTKAMAIMVSQIVIMRPFLCGFVAVVRAVYPI
jgi:hypothetical protein